MAKYYGKIGFVKSEEVERGIYCEKLTERSYYGDTVKYGYRLGSNNLMNPGLSPSISISIVADDFAIENTAYIRYAEYNKQFWDVTSFEMQYPRINLTLGGVYSGKQT